MMRPLILIAAALALATSVKAQEIPDAPRTNIQNNYFVLGIEAGATFSGVGGVKSTNGGTITSEVSAWPALTARFMYMRGRWGYGLRTEVSIWGKKDAFSATNDLGNPIGNISIYFASPAICISPTVSVNIYTGSKSEFHLGAYAGLALSPHKESFVVSQQNPNYIGVSDVYLYPSTGFQLGAELNYKYWVGQRWAISGSAGFQRNDMRYNDGNGDNGFNLNAIPVTVGTSVRL